MIIAIIIIYIIYNNLYIIYKMELAIPLIALGGMYVISNQKNKNCENSNDKNTNKSPKK